MCETRGSLNFVYPIVTPLHAFTLSNVTATLLLVTDINIKFNNDNNLLCLTAAVKRRVSCATEVEIGKTLGKYLAESALRKEEGEAKSPTCLRSQSEAETDLTDVESSDSTSVC